MAVIVKPNNFVNGTTADAIEVNQNFDTIYQEFNGNIDENNIKPGTTIDNATQAANAAKVNNQDIPRERFQISGNTFGNIDIAAQDMMQLQLFAWDIADGKSLVIKRVRFNTISQECRLNVYCPTAGVGAPQYTSADYKGEETPDFSIFTNNAGAQRQVELHIRITNPGDTLVNITHPISWWLDISHE